MADLLFVLLLVALFAITAGVVRFCDRMVGPDEDVVPLNAPDHEDVREAA